MSPNGQWTPAEDAYPEIEAAADQECREQLPHGLGKCDIYVKGFDLQLHSGAKLAVSYECLANNSNVDFKKGKIISVSMYPSTTDLNHSPNH